MATKQQREYSEKAKAAVRYRAQDDRLKRWTRYQKSLKHQVNDPNKLDDHQPTVNLMAARMRAVPPKLALRTPEFSVEPAFAAQNPNAAPAFEAALSEHWRMERSTHTTQRVLLDAEWSGRGIGMVGYESYWDNDSEQSGAEPERFNRYALLAGVREFISKVAGSAEDTAERDRIGNMGEEYEGALRKLLSERIFHVRVSPFAFALDPTAEDWNDALNMQRMLYLTPRAAKAMFGRKAPEADSVANVAEWAGSDLNERADSDREDPELLRIIPESARRVRVWEFWDIEEQRTVYLDRHYNVLDIGDWRSAHAGYPFVEIPWDMVPDEPYRVGMAEAIEPLSETIHLMQRYGLMELAKAQSKIIGPDTMSPEAREALMSEHSREYVPLTPEEASFVKELEFSSVPGEAFHMEDRVRADLNEMSFTTPSDTGVPAETGADSATEASYIQAGSEAITAFRQHAVEQYARDIQERVLSMMLETGDTPMMVKIENHDPNLSIEDTDPRTGRPFVRLADFGERIEYHFTPSEHKGAYRVEVEPYSLAAQEKDVVRKQLLDIQSLFAESGIIDSRAMLLYLLSTIPGISDPQRFIANTPENTNPVEEEGPSQEQSSTRDQMQGGQGEVDALTQELARMGMSAQGGGGPTAEGDMLAAIMGAQAPLAGR